MFNRAIHTETLPKYLSSDHDPLYRFHQWQANLRVLEVKKIKTVPYVPLRNAELELSSGAREAKIGHFSVDGRHTQRAGPARCQPACAAELIKVQIAPSRSLPPSADAMAIAMLDAYAADARPYTVGKSRHP
jgi:hypothetical protein